MFPLSDLSVSAGGAGARVFALVAGRLVRVAGGRGVGRRRTGTGMLDLRSRGGSLGVLIVGSGRDAAGFRVPDPGVNFVGGGCDVGIN